MQIPSLTDLDIREDVAHFTRDEALAIHDGEEWKKLSDRDLVILQLIQEKLFIPFDVLHEKTEAVLGRPVFAHEFGYKGHLMNELIGRKEKASFSEVIDLLPLDKTVVLIAPDADHTN